MHALIAKEEKELHRKRKSNYIVYLMADISAKIVMWC